MIQEIRVLFDTYSKINTLPTEINIAPNWRNINECRQRLVRMRQRLKEDAVTGSIDMGALRDRIIAMQEDQDNHHERIARNRWFGRREIIEERNHYVITQLESEFSQNIYEGPEKEQKVAFDRAVDREGFQDSRMFIPVHQQTRKQPLRITRRTEDDADIAEERDHLERILKKNPLIEEPVVQPGTQISGPVRTSKLSLSESLSDAVMAMEQYRCESPQMTESLCELVNLLNRSAINIDDLMSEPSPRLSLISCDEMLNDTIHQDQQVIDGAA